MTSYLIVIIRPKKRENRLQTHKKTDREEDIQMDIKAKKET